MQQQMDALEHARLQMLKHPGVYDKDTMGIIMDAQKKLEKDHHVKVPWDDLWVEPAKVVTSVQREGIISVEEAMSALIEDYKSLLMTTNDPGRAFTNATTINKQFKEKYGISYGRNL